MLTGRRELTLALPDGAEVDVEQARAAAERARAAIAAGDWAAAWEAASVAAEIAGRGFLAGHDAPWVQERRARDRGAAAARARVRWRRPGSRSAARTSTAPSARRRELVRAAPLREAGHRLLMEALAARGEVAEALAAYERLRVLLREELGTAPGGAVRALHERLLTGDGPRPPRRPARAPDRLPDRLAQSLASGWVGRHAKLRRLRETAELAAAGETRLVLVTGEGGIGKTRLVAELAHRMPGVPGALRPLRRGGAVPVRPLDRHAAAAPRRMPSPSSPSSSEGRPRAGQAAAGDPRAPAGPRRAAAGGRARDAAPPDVRRRRGGRAPARGATVPC